MKQKKPVVDHDAERLVLSYLLAGDDDQEKVGEVLRGIGSGDFDASGNRGCWSIMQAVERLTADGVALSTASVASALHGLGFSEPTHADLVRMTLEAPSSAESAKSAKRRLVELSRWRYLLEIGDGFRAAFERGGSDVRGLIDQALADFDALSRSSESGVLNYDRVMANRVAELRANAGKAPRVIKTGCEPIDRLVGGLGESDLVVLAAGTGMGKTALAGQVFESMAAIAGQNVLVASAEMQAWELSDRTLSRFGRVPAIRIRNNTLTPAELDDLGMISRAGSTWGRVFVLERKGALTVQQVAQAARSIQRRGGLGLVVVDYIQLISSVVAQERGRTREAEVAAVARGLKNMAMDLCVPVLALSQLNREGSKGEEPELHHLRESGEIEQACNMALFLWQDEKNDGTNVRRLLCKKNRAGPSNSAAMLRWHAETLSFSWGSQP